MRILSAEGDSLWRLYIKKYIQINILKTFKNTDPIDNFSAYVGETPAYSKEANVSFICKLLYMLGVGMSL
jgi:hypothetical protein